MLKTIISLSVFFLLNSFVYAQSFSDVPENHTNYNAIESLKKYGIINWYEDWTFKPDKKLNRVEALKITLLGNNINTTLKEKYSPFNDVLEKDWFSEFVITAKNLGIIKGNPDGKFSPARNVNLAETLKIAIISAWIQINQDEHPDIKPYADVQVTDWFSPFFKYAKEQKLLSVSSNNIYPASNITRAEIAEIIFRLRESIKKENENKNHAIFYSETAPTLSSGEIYNKHELTAAHREFEIWTQIKVKNLLNNKSIIVRINNSNINNPKTTIKLSKSAFDLISPLSKNFIPVEISKIKEINDNELITKNDCNWPNNKDYLNKNFFFNDKENINIKLKNAIPTIFIENEIITIEWTIENSNNTVITAFIIEWDKKTTFKSEINSDNSFFIQVNSGDVGKKQLSIIPGKWWTNYIWEIEVKSITCDKDLPDNKNSQANDYDISIINNELKLKWNNNNSELSKINFIQNDIKIIKYISKNINEWTINLKEFKNLSLGNFQLSIDTATSSGWTVLQRNSKWKIWEIKQLLAGEHNYSLIDKSLIEIQEINNTFGFGGYINIKGRTKSNILPEIIIITPSGKILSKPISYEGELEQGKYQDKVIPKLKSFNFSYKPLEHGTYIFEINNENWSAIINTPIYESDTTPIIPDYHDLKTSYSIKDINLDINAFSSKIINLINNDRISSNLEVLVLDQKLTKLAQDKADIMNKENYLSHWDKEWREINEIRINYWIKTSISENLAREINVKTAHFWLMRSWLHRQNILNKNSTRLWLGFAINPEKWIIVVELFSTNPIEDDNLPSLREDLLDKINTQRTKFFTPSATLTAVAQNWSNKMSEEQFFDFKDINNESLTNEVRNAWVLKTVWSFIIGNASWDKLVESILNNLQIMEIQWQKIWIGINQDIDGIIKSTILYSE